MHYLSAEAVFTTALRLKYAAIDYLTWQAKLMPVGNHACEPLPGPCIINDNEVHEICDGIMNLRDEYRE